MPRLPLDNESAVKDLVDRHKRENPGRDLYYFFLYPRPETGFPDAGSGTQLPALVPHSGPFAEGGRAVIDLFSGISSTGQLIIRLIAAVGGFVVGYMFSGPFGALIWRIAKRQADSARHYCPG